MISKDSRSATFSQGSVDGLSQLDLLDGLMMNPSGPAPAPASPSARQESEEGPRTSATFGQSFSASSRSAVLQQLLESRLHPSLDTNGSPEYALTWSRKTMPSGPSICALRASARLTSDSECGGWPTPDASAMNMGCDWEKHKARLERMAKKHNNGNGAGLTLGAVAAATGWPTPRTVDAHGRSLNDGKRGASLIEAAAGWATPTTRDHKDTGDLGGSMVRKDGKTRLDALGRQAWIAGKESSSLAPTEKRGALNPALSRWLMGYPAEWDSCGVMAMQSCRRSRRNSSGR